MKFLRSLKSYIGVFTLSVCMAFAFTSCNDSFIFDDEGDCSLHYKLKFRYDMNLKWADAFSNEVKSVRVYVFNEKNICVKEYLESGDALASSDFAIDLDLPAGKYSLIAWCGIDNPGIQQQSFFAPQSPNLEMENLFCRLNTRENASGFYYSDSRLLFMFYGKLDVEIEESDNIGGERFFTMPLVKDTNHIRVTLVQLSGEDTNVNDFSYTIEAANGYLDYLNGLEGDVNIIYQPWDLDNAETVIENIQGVPMKSLSAVADLDVCRMTVGEAETMKLTIKNNLTNEIVASVPIIDYALLAKDYYEMAYGHTMTNQEFLDREDEYNLTFFLDSNLQWINSFIYINSWRVVLHEYDV